MINTDLNTPLLICQVSRPSGTINIENPTNFISEKVISRTGNPKNVMEFSEKTRPFKVRN